MYLKILSLLLIGFIQTLIIASDTTTDETHKELNEKDEIYQKIIFSVNQEDLNSPTPTSVSIENIQVDELSKIDDTLLDILENAPAVSASGQGGYFQTYSIRGISKNRIKTLVESVPLVTERRAGIAGSFIDPNILSSVDLIKGPVSTFFGSGALGGASNLHLESQKNSRMTFGLDTNGFYTSLHHNSENQNLILTHRDYQNGQSSDGIRLNNGYNLSNFYYRNSWQLDTLDLEILWLETRAKDIGKSNNRYQISRNSSYPEENHRLIKMSLDGHNQWRAALFIHPNDLTSLNEIIGEKYIYSHNESSDFGGQFQKLFTQENFEIQWGLDWFSRRQVKASEKEFDNKQLLQSTKSIINNAWLDDIALYTSILYKQENFNINIGFRHNIQNSSSERVSSIRHKATTAFAGINYSLNSNWKLFTNIASGFRFPNLSEQFLSGTSPRGTIISVSDLDMEESLNLDMGLEWSSENISFSAQGFQMKVDNYIEKFQLEGNKITYLNLDEGKIHGFETTLGVSGKNQQLDINYSHYAGKDSDGNWLADIPSARLNLNYHWQASNWSVVLKWQHRRKKTSFSSDELSSPSFNLLKVATIIDFNNQWSLRFSIDNLFDKAYIPSNDILDTWAEGRTFSMSVLWQAAN